MVASSFDSPRTDLGALEDSASRAGMALACCYSSATEFEAEIIRERRAAGAYGNPHVAQVRMALAALFRRIG